MPNEPKQILHKNIRGREYYAECIREQKETSPLSRLRDFIEWAKANGMCESFYDFEKQCGLSPRYITNSTTNSKGDISSSILGKVVRKYPMLNLTWLCTGEGDMIGSVNYDYREVYNKTLKELEVERKKITRILEIINK